MVYQWQNIWSLICRYGLVELNLVDAVYSNQIELNGIPAKMAISEAKNALILENEWWNRWYESESQIILFVKCLQIFGDRWELLNYKGVLVTKFTDSVSLISKPGLLFC